MINGSNTHNPLWSDNCEFLDFLQLYNPIIQILNCWCTKCFDERRTHLNTDCTHIQFNTQVESHKLWKSRTWLFSNMEKCSGRLSEVSQVSCLNRPVCLQCRKGTIPFICVVLICSIVIHADWKALLLYTKIYKNR